MASNEAMEEPGEGARNGAFDEPSKEDRNWAMIAHAGAFVVSLISGGLLTFAVPLTIYLVQSQQSSFVASHAKESLNFRLTLSIGYIVLIAFVVITMGVGICFVVPLLILIGILELVFSIIASAKAMAGEAYEYPIAFRFIT